MTNTESTNYVTVEMFNAGIERIEHKLEQATTELKTEIRVINARLDATNTRITDLQSSMSSYFALITLVITLMGIFVSVIATFAPRIWAYFESKSKAEKTKVIIDPTTAKTFGSLGRR